VDVDVDKGTRMSNLILTNPRFSRSIIIELTTPIEKENIMSLLQLRLFWFYYKLTWLLTRLPLAPSPRHPASLPTLSNSGSERKLTLAEYFLNNQSAVALGVLFTLSI
jgi:hypothetical protein